MTEGQKRAFDSLWQQYGVNFEALPLNLSSIFSRDVYRTLEIGFGAGTSFVETAGKHTRIMIFSASRCMNRA